MLVLWLTTGIAAATEAPVERRGKGGSSRWRVRHEAETQALDPAEPAVSVETIRAAARPRKALQPEPVEEQAAPLAARAPTSEPGVVIDLFRVATPPVPEQAATPATEVVETEETRRALGLQRIERTYDLELLLLMAA